MQTFQDGQQIMQARKQNIAALVRVLPEEVIKTNGNVFSALQEIHFSHS
jgi:hypothetical protein